MTCLACGDCCNRMSPFTHGKCPNVVESKPTVFVCGIYNSRPEECVKHDYPCHVCPVGLNTLGITDPEAMRQRADLAWGEQTERRVFRTTKATP